jgi:hypothetical protein
MRTNRLRGLIILSLIMTLAGACGTSQKRAVTSSDNSRNAGSSATNSTTSSTTNSATRSAANSPVRVSSKLYTAPDNAFAINIPAEWQVEREENDGAYMTMIRPAEQRAANLSIMTIDAAPAETDSAELQSYTLTEAGEPFFRGWVEGLREQARVEGEGDVRPTRFANTSALRMDVTYYRGDADDPRRGRAIFLIGEDTTFFVSLTASSQLFGELEEIVSTLRIEP